MDTHQGFVPSLLFFLLQTIGDPVAALAAMELTLSNVLIPECTDGTTYDALYCDASLSEEDLPTFLSLLKPGGKMVVVIEEDALLVVRGTAGDPHDFSREVGRGGWDVLFASVLRLSVHLVLWSSGVVLLDSVQHIGFPCIQSIQSHVVARCG